MPLVTKSHDPPSNPLSKEYTLNYHRNPRQIYGIFLTSAVCILWAGRMENRNNTGTYKHRQVKI